MKSNYLVATALPLCLLLSACGGGGSGGGGGVNSIPPAPPTAPVPPPPTPPPPPPPPPPPIDTSTAEFGRSEGIAHANAASAYSAGATGQGITVGIIDSGIDSGSAEFAGRISAASQDVAGNRGLDDIGGHGTSVTGVLGAARNDLEIVGMAFDATLLVLRTDEPGSCANVDPDEGCTHSTSDIARGIDIAIQNNARVVNISLGGGDFTSTMHAAIGRAAAAGVVVVISAGNDSAAQPDPLSLVAITPEANGHVIIAGSVGQNDVISDFSNRAGTGQAAYLAALGERVRSFDHEGTAFLFSGTSYSTPQITGAVALLAQAFPNLGGGEIVQLLFQTARDAGAAGDDAVYGQGILDLFEAFQPQGQTVLAGSNAPVDFGINATLSAPMGDAQQSGLGAVILDGYDRAFAIDLASSVQRAIQPR
ncbi:MAG: S8 family serine peptidase, partial [Sphingomonadaceae bacterium]|nr:S8 family serine peptidase [Sphingomonadaceae bacterium]